MSRRSWAWLLLALVLALLAALVVWRGLRLAPEPAPAFAVPPQRAGVAISASSLGQRAPAAGPRMADGLPSQSASAGALAVDQASPAWLAAPSPATATSLPAPGVEQADTTAKRAERAERVARRAQIQALLARYQREGANLSLAEAEQMLTELQRITAGSPSAAYVAEVRQSLQYAAQAQSLAQELQSLQPITSQEAVARQQEILAQLRTLSQQISVASANAGQAAAAVQRRERP